MCTLGHMLATPYILISTLINFIPFSLLELLILIFNLIRDFEVLKSTTTETGKYLKE
jgi:hypothetical protein